MGHNSNRVFWCCARRFLCSTTSPPRLSYPTRAAGAVTLRLALEEPAQQRGASGIDADQPVDWLANIRGGAVGGGRIESCHINFSNVVRTYRSHNTSRCHRSRETLIGRDMPVRRHDRPDSRIRGRVGRRGDAHRDDDGVRQRFPLEAVRVEAIPIAGPASTFTSVARIEAYSVCGRETVRTTGRRLTAFT